MGLDGRTWTRRGFAIVGTSPTGDVVRYVSTPLDKGLSREDREVLAQAFVDLANSSGEPVLTPTQRAVIEFVRKYHTKKGTMPSLRQIGAGIGVAHATADKALDHLAEVGLITRPPKGSRQSSAAIGLPERNAQ